MRPNGPAREELCWSMTLVQGVRLHEIMQFIKYNLLTETVPDGLAVELNIRVMYKGINADIEIMSLSTDARP